MLGWFFFLVFMTYAASIQVDTAAISAVRSVIHTGIIIYTASGIFCSEYVGNAAGVFD